LTDEQVDTIIEAHTDTVAGLKTDLAKYKDDAEKLSDVQKELDDLKAAGDGGYKEKYEKEHSDFEKYKADQAAKETRVAKEKAYRDLLKAAGVSDKRIDSVIKVTDLNSVELEGDKVKDAEKIMEGVKTEWADFIESSNTSGANTPTPPANNPGTDKDLGSLSMEDYIKERTKK
jgi:hypothetical protein